MQVLVEHKYTKVKFKYIACDILLFSSWPVTLLLKLDMDMDKMYLY